MVRGGRWEEGLRGGEGVSPYMVEGLGVEEGREEDRKRGKGVVELGREGGRVKEKKRKGSAKLGREGGRVREKGETSVKLGRDGDREDGKGMYRKKELDIEEEDMIYEEGGGGQPSSGGR